MINAAADQIPLPRDVQPENELKPDPARLAFLMRQLEIDITEIVEWIRTRDVKFKLSSHAGGKSNGGR